MGGLTAAHIQAQFAWCWREAARERAAELGVTELRGRISGEARRLGLGGDPGGGGGMGVGAGQGAEWWWEDGGRKRQAAPQSQRAPLRVGY